jgi:hypothetical protein
MIINTVKEWVIGVLQQDVDHYGCQMIGKIRCITLELM